MSAIDDLAGELSKLPGIGRKTALRLTYFLLKQRPEQSRRLADALTTLAERVRPCAECFNLTEEERCSVCRDQRRDRGVICAVEEASDIGAIERTGEYRGLYHVLGGRLSPLDGVMPEDLTIDRLIARVRGGEVREVILATNPSLEGEATALYVQRQLSGQADGVAVTRIARGLPVGGDLEYADGVTIAQALSARREM
ncbi:recombination mediator RecR [Roseisolibacter sp. H3M3-2]|uniref:recombination mediator RecR n=1 Tax=Roseisolibacter sp. H3M3-2 TaxID=3031323 RepID=UPI0023DB58C2|nr:recombination mediator RecR [Roseisolibacter sp. H3M3-2]MDF1505644.1 recombination mediator RecR [Roseisolibacter sp. H3M3-2]